MIGPWRRARDAERALEVAETDRDIARAEKASAYEAIGKIAAAAGRPGAPTRWNVEDLVDWALEAQSWGTRHTRMVQQAETFEAELIAIDEALAKVGGTPGDDRVDVIRALAAAHGRDAWDRAIPGDPRPPLDGSAACCSLVYVPGLGGGPASVACCRPTGHHGQHVAVGRTSVLGVAQNLDDGVVDAEIACGAAIPWPVTPGFLPHCGRAADHEGRCFPARDAWCSADLDGARCARPAGHAEPCRPREPVPSTPTARCEVYTLIGRCELVAGHPGAEHPGATF